MRMNKKSLAMLKSAMNDMKNIGVVTCDLHDCRHLEKWLQSKFFDLSKNSRKKIRKQSAYAAVIVTGKFWRDDGGDWYFLIPNDIDIKYLYCTYKWAYSRMRRNQRVSKCVESNYEKYVPLSGIPLSGMNDIGRFHTVEIPYYS